MVRVGKAVAIRIVKRPAGILGRLFLGHRKAVRAGLGELELTELDRLGIALGNGSVGGNLKLAVAQTLDVLSLVLLHERKREGVVRRGIRTLNGLGHLDLRVSAAANHSRIGVVIVHEAKLRSRIAIRRGIQVVAHNFIRNRAVPVHGLRHRGDGMHGAVAVVQHLNVNAVLGLVEVDALEIREGLVTCKPVLKFVDEERVGLASVRLIEGQLLQLLHLIRNTRRQDPMGELEVLLMELGGVFLGFTRDGEEEGPFSLGAVVERLGHHDAASTLGAVVHGRLIGVVELSLVSHRAVCAVAVGHIGLERAVMVVRHVDRHSANVAVVGHAGAVGGLSAVLIGNLIYRERILAHLGEGHLTEVEVGRTVGKARHLNRLGVRQHALSVGVRCLQLEVEGLASFHVAASKRLRAVDGVVARQGSIGRIVGVSKLEFLGSNIRRRYYVRTVIVTDLRHRHLDGVLSLVIRHARFGLTILVLGELGHLVLVGATKVTAIKGNGAEGETVSRVVHGLGVARLIGPCRQRDLVYAIGIRVGLRVVGVIATKRLNLEGEFVGVDGVAAHVVGIVLGAVNVGGATVSIVLVDESHRVALNRNGRVILHAVIVSALFDGNVGNLQVARTVVRHRDYHTVEGTRIVDARNRIGVVVLNDTVAVLARHREGNVAEGGRVVRSLAVHCDGGASGLRRGNVSSSRVAQAIDLKRELIGVAPIAALEVLLNLECGVGVEAHLIRMVCVAERERCLRAGGDRAGHNTIRSAGVLDTLLARGVFHRPAILANALLGHGKRRASGEPIDADRSAAGNVQLRLAVGERHLAGGSARIANVVVVGTGKGLSCLALTCWDVGRDVKREGVLVLLGLIGSVAPIDILLDLERTGHLERQLAVVAKRLGHIAGLSP